ncbi:hypothetical protein ARMSODRAFT_978380 [Armillaria solidipes]|uniref:Uncharacterized protein n=1 Tax=Armillaria solidipes TaxID=1076256 RepID=A0A2H3B6F2_9AGAR|nr:hypothetical protein ARMSODRAFT_978380 [Armillaria solidipes]
MTQNAYARQTASQVELHQLSSVPLSGYLPVFGTAAGREDDAVYQGRAARTTRYIRIHNPRQRREAQRPRVGASDGLKKSGEGQWKDETALCMGFLVILAESDFLYLLRACSPSGRHLRCYFKPLSSLRVIHHPVLKIRLLSLSLEGPPYVLLHPPGQPVVQDVLGIMDG